MRLTLLVLAAAALASCTRSADPSASLVANDGTAVFDTVADAPLSRRTFSFTNVGLTKTRPLQVELSGDRDAFVIDWDGCSGATLEQDGHCEVVVRLDGVAAGAFDGELRVFADAPLSASVVLHGKVAPASLTLTAISSATADVGQGETALLAFTVHNAGGAPTGVVRVTGTALPFDLVTGDCDGATLAGGASCTIKMSHAVPQDGPVGTSAGALEVAATPGGEVSATPTLVVHAAGVLVVSSFDFGMVPTLTPKSHNFTVTNPDKTPSGPLSIHLASDGSGTDPFAVGFDGCSGKSLAGGAACTVTVTAQLEDASMHTTVLTASSPSLATGSGMVGATGVRAHWMLWVSVAGNGTGKVAYGARAPEQLPVGGVGFLIKNGQPSEALTATADNGSTFAGWSGAAPCSGTGACAAFTGADNSDVTVTATFTR